MTSAVPFDAVIFDCDGVLIDSERLINDLESQLFSQLGLALSPEAARARFKGHTVAEIVAIVEALRGDRLPADWTYDWGMQIALGFVRRLRAVPGVEEVVGLLARREVRLGVASQAPRARVDLGLSVTGLARHFADRVFTADLVPRVKPAPDVFLLAAARLGAEPSRCAVVEDSPSGVTAAVVAGMAVFGYAADEDPAALAIAGATPFHDMRELPALLDQGRPAEPPPLSQPESCRRLRAAYDGLAAGDVGAMARFLSSDVVYHLPGRHLGGGTLRGWPEVLTRIAKGALACDGPPAMQLTHVVGAADLLLSVERFRARRRGRALDQEVCVVWRMAGERCVEVWARFAEPLACDRFWEGV